MQDAFVNILRCPVSRQKLEVKTIERRIKSYNAKQVDEIYTALLFSPNGMVYPVIKGIPRMQVESILCFADFWETHFPEFEQTKAVLLNKYGDIIKNCFEKNEATRKSFSLEWSLLKRDGNEKVWHDDHTQLKQQVLKEIGETNLSDKWVADMGCGHGLSSVVMAESGAKVIGVDLSFSIEKAYEHLQNENIFLAQADLQFPPLENNFFDVIYSSGVIHHTNNTELSFNIIQNLVKKQGKVCIWLYHNTSSLSYNLMLGFRKITRHVPARVQFWAYLFTLLPIYLLLLTLKKNKLTWRNAMIDLMDTYTPRYRFHHTPEETKCWYAKMGFCDSAVTDTNMFGFAITGVKG